MKRNKYSLSNYRLTSMNMGELVPIGLTEVLPGDTFRHNTTALVRFAPMLAPVMHPVHVKIHHWFVPHRLVWEDWESFITGGADGMDDSVFPTVLLAPSQPGDLPDYLGVNPAYNSDVSALPFRGYALIFNEWYRDQDLQTELALSIASGFDTTTSTSLQRVAWNKDYFSTARPWTQKGPDVTLPFAASAPVQGIGKLNNVFGVSNQAVIETGGGTPTYPNSAVNDITNNNTAWYFKGTGATGAPDINADLSDAPGSINELRLAFALQRYEEARARYGSRYTEYLRYLGVKSSDARLQRPEYLGGGKQTIQFSEVLQTAPGDDTQGDTVAALKGHGIGSARSNRYQRFFEEHGYVHSFMSVTPIPVYPDGMQRTWWRRTKEDFFQKELQYIGQQELLNGEVYATASNSTTVKLPFGYQDRYADYRQGFHQVTGKFRTDLDYWQLARQFPSQPTLNGSFVQCNPSNRIFADQTAGAQSVQCMIKHSIQARRMVGPGGKSFVF